MAGRGALWWLLGLAGLLGAVLIRAWDPTEGGWSVCVLRSALGQPCPGCGLTRAAGHLARGQLGAAFLLHPLAFPLAIEAAFAWVAWGVLGGARFHRFVAEHAGVLALVNAVPLLALWLGRAATGTLPF